MLIDKLESERNELGEKIQKLIDALDRRDFKGISQRELMKRQLGAMLDYGNILRLRIIDLKKDKGLNHASRS